MVVNRLFTLIQNCFCLGSAVFRSWLQDLSAGKSRYLVEQFCNNHCLCDCCLSSCDHTTETIGIDNESERFGSYMNIRGVRMDADVGSIWIDFTNCNCWNRLWVRFLAVLDIYPMFIEPTITWVPSGFSGYIWLDTKIVLKKKICWGVRIPDCQNHLVLVLLWLINWFVWQWLAKPINISLKIPWIEYVIWTFSS